MRGERRLSYELSKLYYITDKTLITISKLSILATVLLTIQEYTKGTIDNTLLIGTSITIIGCLIHIHNTVNITYKQYKNKLGHNDYPSAHIVYTQGVFELTRVSRYTYIPFDNIQKVGALNLGFTVLILIKSSEPEETAYFLMNRKLAMDFRERLRVEILNHRKQQIYTKQHNQPIAHQNVKHG